MVLWLEGEWLPVQLFSDGKPMPNEWLARGSRSMKGNELRVVFGGQTMVHARVRVDETTMPRPIDYFDLRAGSKGTVSHGILEWIGDEVRILMAPAGAVRPTSFTDAPQAGTLSRWRRC